MATIFISHASRDDSFAKQLSEDLALVGHTPWIDDLDIQPGHSIISSIQNGITRSRHVIVVLSVAAISSSWVDREWKEKLWDTINNQKIRVIPVLREACDTPPFLRTLRYADFTRSYAVGFAQLCITLKPTRSQVPDIIDRDFLHAIEHAARTHHDDHIRLACAHTVWSCRPDRAKPILEDALHDQRDVVRIHAQVLLTEFYN
ncbi:MAG TPA: toll/interleukin-1 receptor domain-containing protein [Candidatus Sulfotelmatobacter sp.]|nr:toll/interleukin-1 receptor domain-containing protein [Candidatus Sulfotelmatobacter sp.]